MLEPTKPCAPHACATNDKPQQEGNESIDTRLMNAGPDQAAAPHAGAHRRQAPRECTGGKHD
eukprot:1160791-Pelagomonas_calceolata.AAC.8